MVHDGISIDGDGEREGQKYLSKNLNDRWL